MTATNVEKFSFPTATSTIVEGATSSGVSATTSIESTTFASSSSSSTAAAAAAAFFQSAYEVITTVANDKRLILSTKFIFLVFKLLML